MDCLKALDILIDGVRSERDMAQANRNKVSFWTGARDHVDGQIHAYTEVLHKLHSSQIAMRKALQNAEAPPLNLIDL